VEGTISGAAFTAKDAIAFIQPDRTLAKIVVSSTPDLCADVRGHVARQNSRVLLIEVATAAGSTLSPGSYTTDQAGTPLHSTLFECNVTDAQCAVSYDPPPDGTGSGLVTLTAVTDATVSGSFDVILENSEHVTGTFDPTACPELANAGSPTSCVP
jgi:hypothetical protein